MLRSWGRKCWKRENNLSRVFGQRDAAGLVGWKAAARQFECGWRLISAGFWWLGTWKMSARFWRLGLWKISVGFWSWKLRGARFC
ncbi:hypothetical protein GBA52_020266 [Prunus armeniaca]|nr:hypothetical protein GBA52_020266 [Prunus armeniaca]